MAYPSSFLKFIGLLIILPLVILCGTSEETAAQFPALKRTLTVTKSGDARTSGRVTADPDNLTWDGNTGTGSYNFGATVTLTAIASTGYPNFSWFQGWYGGGCTGPGICTATDSADRCIESSCTVTMSAAKNVIAYFDKPNTITPPSFIIGTIAPSIGGAVITTIENYATSLPDGSFFMSHDAGTFDLNITAESCTPYMASVTVLALQDANVTVALTCSWTSTLLSSTGQAFESGSGTGSGTGSVTVTIPASLYWTAVSNAAWITITAPTGTANGNGTVSYSVAANGTSSPRTGTLTIAGQTFTVTQANPDTTAPKVTAVTAASQTNSLTIPVTIAATDNRAGTIKYLVTGSSTPPLAGDTGWTTTNPFSYTVAAAGTYSLYGWAKDAAGNVSNAATPVKVVVDQKAPSTIANPTGGTFGPGLSVTLTTKEIATIYYTTDGNTPTVSSSVYSAPIPIPSNRTLKYFARDLAGNIEAVKSQTYTIDTVGPVGSVALADAITYTNGRMVSLVLSSADAVQMQFSNDGSSWSSPEAYGASKLWTLAADDGMKTIYVKFKDAVGNWSNADTATVTLDTIPPVTSASPAGGYYDSVQHVILSADEESTIYFTTNGAVPSESSGIYAAPIPIAATTTLRFFAKDRAENLEAVKSAIYIQSGSMGDVNADGTVNLTDAVLALQVLARMTPSQSVSDHGAVTMEGKIGLAEAIYILQRIAGVR